MSEPITLESLQRFDQGALAILFAKAMRQIQLDLEDRPRLGTARKVKLEIRFKPEEDGEGNLEAVEIDYDCDALLPKKKGRVNLCLPHSEIGICFDGDTSRTRTKPGQQSLEFEDEN